MKIALATLLLLTPHAALPPADAYFDDASVKKYWQADQSPMPKLNAQFFKSGLHARITIQFRIDRDGKADDVQVIDKFPDDLDETPFTEAVAARTYVASPENKQRHPVTVRTETLFGGATPAAAD